MRIIAGEKRGLLLNTPEGKNIRPTYDRVREAIFGKLQFCLQGRRVLDLFAGSGALGLEALSRGAECATFVDASAQAARIIAANIAKAGYGACTRLIKNDYKIALKLFQNTAKFDMIFIDPPYASDLYQSAVQWLLDCDVMAQGALIVLESDAPPDISAQDIVCTDVRKYGKSYVSYLEYQG